MTPRSFQHKESSWSILALTRFFLATIIFTGHLHFYVLLPHIIKQYMTLGGKAAVLGFLLISGLSVGNSYINSKVGYFKRRFLRIYPVYFFAVLITVFLQYFLGTPYQLNDITLISAGWLTSIANFLLLQGFASITITYNGPLWSLSVEVFFYLLVPLLFKLQIKFLYLIIVISMACFAVLHYNFSYGSIALVFAWPWLIGFLLSARNKINAALLLLTLGIVLVGVNKNISGEKLSWVTFSIVSLILFLCIYLNIKLSEPIIKIFNYLGELSYPLYVFHTPVYLVLFYFGFKNAWIYLLCLLIIIVPANHLLDHWLKNIFWKPLINFITNKCLHLLFRLKQKTRSFLPLASRS